MKYKLTKEQTEIYNWLKEQEINTDDDTLNYWTRQYSGMRIMEIVTFAKARIQSGQNIKNLGGWIHKFLKTGLAVVNDECMTNHQFAKQFMKINGWEDLKIFEKYVKDEITGDDLPLTMESHMFRINLEKLFEKSQLYKFK
jgi:hypothetical protein